MVIYLLIWNTIVLENFAHFSLDNIQVLNVGLMHLQLFVEGVDFVHHIGFFFDKFLTFVFDSLSVIFKEVIGVNLGVSVVFEPGVWFKF